MIIMRVTTLLVVRTEREHREGHVMVGRLLAIQRQVTRLV